jgi:hypothetical protein
MDLPVEDYRSQAVAAGAMCCIVASKFDFKNLP